MIELEGIPILDEARGIVLPGHDFPVQFGDDEGEGPVFPVEDGPYRQTALLEALGPRYSGLYA